MTGFGKLQVHVVISALLCVAGMASLGGDSGEPLVELRWALGKLAAQSAAPSAIDKDVQLEPGTKLKFLVEPLSPSSVYLILLDSSEQIHLLYHESAKAQQASDGASPTYVPPGSQWFELDDNAGRETFFLLASAEPLVALDALLERHASADPAARQGVVEEIVQEIRRLHKEHRRFSRPVEKPVMIGGQTRSGGPPASIEQLAVEISAERFYGKSITIDH
ncbi:MAG: DUF4384 domain-containing protein [Acidobacteriota bacterium]|nr:MAG: DUF4384 domain-containing protein [Acidobacteriota bacterium]